MVELVNMATNFRVHGKAKFLEEIAQRLVE
jgi:hypothetical protein